MLLFVELEDRLDSYETTTVNIGIFDSVISARAAAIMALDEYTKIHYGTTPQAYVWAARINTTFAKSNRLVTYFKVEKNKIVRYNVVVTDKTTVPAKTKIDYDHPEYIDLV